MRWYVPDQIPTLMSTVNVVWRFRSLSLKLTSIPTGMYSRKTWGGPVDPYISVVFPKQQAEADKDPIVSVVIFEWKDEDLIGVLENPDNPASQVCETEHGDARPPPVGRPFRTS